MNNRGLKRKRETFVYTERYVEHTVGRGGRLAYNHYVEGMFRQARTSVASEQPREIVIKSSC